MFEFIAMQLCKRYNLRCATLFLFVSSGSHFQPCASSILPSFENGNRKKGRIRVTLDSLMAQYSRSTKHSVISIQNADVSGIDEVQFFVQSHIFSSPTHLLPYTG